MFVKYVCIRKSKAIVATAAVALAMCIQPQAGATLVARYTFDEVSGNALDTGVAPAANGVLHMSVLDGWWYEGYRGDNGWAINGDLLNPDPETEDRADAASIYELLEKEIVPLYYARDLNGVPVEWSKRVKNAVCAVIPDFSSLSLSRSSPDRLMYFPKKAYFRQSSRRGPPVGVGDRPPPIAAP